MITESPFLSPSAPLFIKMSILPINETIFLETAIFMYKMFNNLLPVAFKEFFICNNQVHTYNTRNAQNIHLPFNRTLVTQSSIFYHGTIIWNNLPPLLKDCKTLSQFKRLLKKQLFVDIGN